MYVQPFRLLVMQLRVFCPFSDALLVLALTTLLYAVVGLACCALLCLLALYLEPTYLHFDDKTRTQRRTGYVVTLAVAYRGGDDSIPSL